MGDPMNKYDVSAKDALEPDPISFLMAADIGIDGEITEKFQGRKPNRSGELLRYFYSALTLGLPVEPLS